MNGRCFQNSFVAVAALILAIQLSANSTGWWTASSTSIVDSSQSEDNWAPVNVGQLKNVAAQAHAYLQQHPEAGSNSQIAQMVSGFSTNDPENFAPANIGQLITVARPFYDYLQSIGYNTRESLIIRGLDQSWPMGNPYPWPQNGNANELYAPLNIGQLKLVFSFDLDADSSGDGISDFTKWKSGLSYTDSMSGSGSMALFSSDWKSYFNLDPQADLNVEDASSASSQTALFVNAPVN